MPLNASEMMFEILVFPGNEIEGGYVMVMLEDVAIAEIEEDVG